MTDWPVPSPDEAVGWMLVELTGSGIGGVTTLVLDVPYDEVGCGPDGRPIRFDQFEPGTTLTFERGQADTQSPLSGEETPGWPRTVPVSAVRVRTACPAGSDEAAASVADHRAIWAAAGPSTYDYTMRYTTEFLFGTYRISVVDGVPVSAERLEDGEIKNYLDVVELPKSIDEVFDQLEREVAGDRFVGTFDDELGYPTHVLVDRIDHAVDDEWEFFISDFVATAGDTAPDTALDDTDLATSTSNPNAPISVEVTLYHCGVEPIWFDGTLWEVPEETGAIDEMSAPRGFVGHGTLEPAAGGESLRYVDESGIALVFVPDDGTDLPCA